MLGGAQFSPERNFNWHEREKPGKGKGLLPRKKATCELPSECRSNETLLPNVDRCGDYVYEDAERRYRSRHGGDGEVTRTTIKSRAKNSNERSIVRT